MITENELKQILRNAIKQSGNNISQWARENDLYTQRGNISEMAYGKKKISKKVAEKLDYVPTKNVWVLDKKKKD